MAPSIEVSAKPWRGIQPLLASREEVVRKFHQCQDGLPSCEFALDNEFVHIEFSGNQAGLRCPKDLPADKVLLIHVTPRFPVKLKALGFSQKSFKSFQLSGGALGLIDGRDGLVLKLYRGKVVQLDYVASASDVSLCPEYYKNSESFVEVFRSHVPMIDVSCPTGPIRPGDQIPFSVASADNSKFSFVWSISAGRILAGQGTRVITVDTSGLNGKTIIAAVKLDRAQATCHVQIAQ